MIERPATQRRWYGALKAGLLRARRTVAGVRVRIVFGYVVLLAVALVIAVVVTRQVQLARADREFEQEQAQEVAELRLLSGGLDPETGEPFGDDVEALLLTFLRRSVPSDDEAFYTIVDGNYFFYSNAAPPLYDDPQFLPLWTVASPTQSTTSSRVDKVGEVRWLAVPLFADERVAGVFVVARFPADDYGEVDQLVRVITLVGLAVLAITSALAWSLAGRVLRPVRDLTETARQITESDLSARIPVEGRDELAELGTTFNDMVDRLEHGFNSQRRFIDDVAHELRTPITIARGHLEVIGDDPADQAETIDVVTDELDRMSRYVNDLLLLAKAEQPDFLLARSFDLGDLALDMFQRVRAVGARSWVIDEATPPGSVTIVADPERLSQAMINLAANAVQHTDPDAEVGLGVAVSTNTVRMWIRDTGRGIDPAVADTLFDRYSRAATSRTRRPDGSGIGLSIVDAIARAHGGTVNVDSRLGHGATFVIAFPSGAAVWAPPNVLHPASPTSPTTVPRSRSVPR